MEMGGVEGGVRNGRLGGPAKPNNKSNKTELLFLKGGWGGRVGEVRGRRGATDCSATRSEFAKYLNRCQKSEVQETLRTSANWLQVQHFLYQKPPPAEVCVCVCVTQKARCSCCTFFFVHLYLPSSIWPFKFMWD